MNDLAAIIWAFMSPILLSLGSILGPIIAVWLAAKVTSLMNISDANKRKELEEKLRDALHQSALNGLKYAAAKYAGRLHGFGFLDLVQPEILSTATEYIRNKNPDATDAFNLSDRDLHEIIMTKIPDVKALLETSK